MTNLLEHITTLNVELLRATISYFYRYSEMLTPQTEDDDKHATALQHDRQTRIIKFIALMQSVNLSAYSQIQLQNILPEVVERMVDGDGSIFNDINACLQLFSHLKSVLFAGLSGVNQDEFTAVFAKACSITEFLSDKDSDKTVRYCTKDVFKDEINKNPTLMLFWLFGLMSPYLIKQTMGAFHAS